MAMKTTQTNLGGKQFTPITIKEDRNTIDKDSQRYKRMQKLRAHLKEDLKPYERPKVKVQTYSKVTGKKLTVYNFASWGQASDFVGCTNDRNEYLTAKIILE